MTTDKTLGHLGVNDSVDRRNELEMLNWALLAQNKAASALSRADDKESLLREVCQSIVAQKPYELAWVGFAQHDIEKSVSIAAVEGSAKAYVTQIQVNWADDSTFGTGPAGTCLRTGTASLFEDCMGVPGFAAWSDHAAAFGLRSVVAVPFLMESWLLRWPLHASWGGPQKKLKACTWRPWCTTLAKWAYLQKY